MYCSVAVKSSTEQDGRKPTESIRYTDEEYNAEVGAKSCTRALHARRARHTHALRVCIRRAVYWRQ